MGMAAILCNGAEPLNKISTSFRQKAPCEIWWKLFSQFQWRIKIFKYFTILYSQGARADNPKNLMVAKQFYYLNHML